VVEARRHRTGRFHPASDIMKSRRGADHGPQGRAIGQASSSEEDVSRYFSD
jgi:hypothetical protein